MLVVIAVRFEICFDGGTVLGLVALFDEVEVVDRIYFLYTIA